jgi:hypothetical protein
MIFNQVGWLLIQTSSKHSESWLCSECMKCALSHLCHRAAASVKNQIPAIGQPPGLIPISKDVICASRNGRTAGISVYVQKGSNSRVYTYPFFTTNYAPVPGTL